MRLHEVYKNSGLGKWFHKQSATKEPGWDRYNTTGKRVGKCGDAKEGESYSACLSKQKAQKLGKEGISSFVKRKRSAQKEAGRGKKGSGAKGKKPIFVETGSAKKKVNESMINVNENCGCEHDKTANLIGKIKDKVKNKTNKEQVSSNKSTDIRESTKFSINVQKGKQISVNFDPNPEETQTLITERRIWKNDKIDSQTIKECMDFTELDLTTFRGKKTLVETVNGNWHGILGIYKNNFALFEGNEVLKVIDPTEIVKVVCENKKILILEKNKPNDPEKWSSCKNQAKSKFDVYPSAYANAWASKCYKKKGGTWTSVKEDVNTELELLNEVIKHKDGKWVVMNKEQTKVLGTHPSKSKAVAQLRAIEAHKHMNEATQLLLREKIRDLFFSEEVVNKDHKGSMTAAEIEKRDKIAAQLKKRGNIKGLKQKKD